MNDLTLVIPAKNESESLPLVLAELKNFKVKKLIVLDKNDKQTIDSIRRIPNIDILHQDKLGYGSAIIEGIKKVQTTYFCIFNADGSFDPKDLYKMHILLKKYDFIFGSRYQAFGGSDDDNIVTYVGNFFFSKIGKFFFKLPISDILYTYVMGNTKKANFLKLNKKDFSFCVELPIKAYRSKMKLISIPCYERKKNCRQEKSKCN